VLYPSNEEGDWSFKVKIFLLGGLFHNDNIKQCSRKSVSSSKKLNELRGVVHS
jgi:hypothetical protein